MGGPVAGVLLPGLVADAGRQNRVPVGRFRPAQPGPVSSRQRVGVVGRQVVEVPPRQGVGPVGHGVAAGAAHPGERKVAFRRSAEFPTGKGVGPILGKVEPRIIKWFCK